jgi:hypothetical protein
MQPLHLVHPAVALIAGLAVSVAGLRLWSGGSEVSPAIGGQQFGRHASTRTQARRRLSPVLLALPFLVAAFLIVDHVRPWPAGGELDDPPAAKSQPEPAAPVAEPPAAVPPSRPPSELAVEEPAAVPPTVIAPPELAGPPPIDAAEPPGAAVAEPPVTVAPLPEPPEPETSPSGHTHAVVSIDVSPDSRMLISAGIDRAVKLWDLKEKRLVRDLGVHKDMARSAIFLPDGTGALTGGDDGEIVLRRLSDGAVLHTFSAAQHGRVNGMALTPDGKRLVSVHQSGIVIVWDLQTKALVRMLQGHEWSINAIAVSPDGRLAISGSIDGTLCLWDIDTGMLVRTWHGHDRGVYGAAFTPDGRRAITGSGDYTIKEWDIDTGKEVRRYDGHSGTVYVLAVSKDGRQIVSGSLDGTTRLWDRETGDQIRMFGGHSGPIYAVDFTGDGAIVAGGEDRTIRVWPIAGADTLTVFPGGPAQP